MINKDTSIKRCTVNILDPATKRYKEYTFTENDVLNIIYTKDGKNINLHGFLLKIGIDEFRGNKEYFTVISYNYGTDNNIHFFYTSDIVQVINVNKSTNPYSFGPVYCGDESVILMRMSPNSELEVSKDGFTWINVTTSIDNSSSLLKLMRERGFKGELSDVADMLMDLYHNMENIVALEIIDI